MDELNEVEAANIAEYDAWARTARPGSLKRALSDEYLQRLHRRMFGHVWRWAGRYRTHDLENAFASPYPRIRQDLRLVWDDVLAMATAKDPAMPKHELAVRLHHRIVKVHPFPNGNGRISRAIADLVLERVLGDERLMWGGQYLGTPGEARAAYIAALADADRGDYRPLVEFCSAGGTTLQVRN